MKDLTRASKIDNLIAVFLGDKEPTPSEQMALERIEFAWSVLHQGYPNHTAARMVMQRFSLGKSQAYLIIQEAVQLFGNITETSRQGSRAIYIDWLKRLARNLELQRKFFEAGLLLAKAAKLEGVDKAETTPGQNPEEWKVPAQVVFTSDPQVFIRNQMGEEIPFEEVPPTPPTDG